MLAIRNFFRIFLIVLISNAIESHVEYFNFPRYMNILLPVAATAAMV